MAIVNVLPPSTTDAVMPPVPSTFNKSPSKTSITVLDESATCMPVVCIPTTESTYAFTDCCVGISVAEFDIMFRGSDVGISREGDIIDLGVNNGIIDKSGTWFSYGDIRLGQGRENARVFLRDNSDVSEDIENQVRDKLQLNNTNDIKGEKIKEEEVVEI